MISLQSRPSFNDASWSDRLNVSWTFRLLIILSILTLVRQYIGQKAICVTPPTSGDQFNKYIDETCWSSRQLLYDHNVVPFHNRDVETLPLVQNENRKFKERQINRSFYQWLPVVLVIQAFLFKLPEVVFKCYDNLNGRKCSRFINMLSEYPKLKTEERKDLTYHVIVYLSNLTKCRCFGKLKICQITMVVAISKALIFLNVAVQLVLLDMYLCSNYSANFYIGHIFHNFGKSNTSSFPSQIQCLIYIRRPQHLQVFSVQCSLPINEFYEYVCLCVWMWMFLVCVLTFCSLCLFICQACSVRYKRRFVQYYLRMSTIEASCSESDSMAIQKMEYDIILLLDFISYMTSDILVCDVIEKLWRKKYNNNCKISNESEPSFMVVAMEKGYSKGSDIETNTSFSSMNESTPDLTPLLDRRFQHVRSS